MNVNRADVLRMCGLLGFVALLAVAGRLAGCESYCDNWQGKYPDHETCVLDQKAQRELGP
ncbi:MAG: hypothetical protein AB7I13_05895 [Vicinamibacterales bacterium]